MKDERLYMTFPNDFHRHPKIERLPVEVRWTFVEMNGEARIADNDGRFAPEDAEFMWPKPHLVALLTSHPTRPLVIRDGDDYVIREYGKHQQTRAEREELRAKRAEAGRKGGLSKGQASASKRLADRSKPKHSQSQSYQPTYVQESSPVSERAREDETARSVIQGNGIDPDRLVKHIARRTGREVSPAVAMRVMLGILDRGHDVDKPQAYVLGSITRSWAEVQKQIDAEIA